MQMGTADAILDLVSSGTTLRENNLKEISGGSVLSSQVYFNKKYIYIHTSLTVYLVAFFSSQF
jgi:ATP phosphoribosyltransferase